MKDYLWILLACSAVASGCDALEPSPGPVGPAGLKRPAVDNMLCLVCHGNYEDEELAVAHASAGVGCVNCHGLSLAHGDDEEHLIPPNIMYAKDKINVSCMVCHSVGTLCDKKEHEMLVGDPATDEVVCTDCHGEHRLERRIRNWDKLTGKLLP